MTFTRPERKSIYKKAIRKWGLGLQLGMLMEECAELIQATHKVVRKGQDEISNFAEEIADVEIMIEQMKSTITWMNLEKRVETLKNEKLLRLKEMLESDKQ